MKSLPLSIVIPIYNEEKSVSQVVSEYKKFKSKYSFELICVNNGSTDNTAKVLKKLETANKFVKVVTIKKNIGYGYGIMSGVRKAKGEVIAWTHADMQTPVKDVFRAFELLKQTKEKALIKGSRSNRNKIDAIVSSFMGVLATIFLLKLMWEINAQPKVFPRLLLRELKNPPKDFLLDLYLLFVAKKKGYRVKSIKVSFLARKHGKSKWATSPLARIKMILRTITYILDLSFKTYFKKILLKIFLALAGVVISLVILEGLLQAAQAVHLISIDPKLSFARDPFVYSGSLKYTIKPYLTRDCTVEGNSKATCFSNSLGFRDSEHEIKKPSGVYRILLIGDSLTYGPGVNFEQSYPKLFEDLVKKENRSVEVIKLGMIFYGPAQYYNIYEEMGKRYKPDLIILSFHLLTDPLDAFDYHINRKFYYLKALPDVLPYQVSQPLKEHSLIFRALLSVYYKWENNQYKNSYGIVSRGRPNRLQVDTQLSTTTPEMKIAWSDIEKYLNTLVGDAGKNGSKVAIVSFPSLPQIIPDGWESMREKGIPSDPRLYDGSETRKKFLQLCAKNNWTCHDLQNDFRKAPEVSEIFLKDEVHLTGVGNIIAAKSIFSFLLRIKYLR